MQNPVEARTHQENDVGFQQRQAAGGAGRQRMVVRQHTLALGRAHERYLRLLDEGPHLFLGLRGRHALADKGKRALRRLQHVEGALDVLRHRHRARGVGAFLHLHHLVGIARASDQIVGDVEIGRAGAAVNRLAHRHLDIERDAVDVLDRVRPLADRCRRQHLALLLERAHAVAVGLRSAADQDHRPAILLRVGEAREAVDDAGAGHDDARARPAGQVADGAGGVGRGLLVTHADIGQADLLRRVGDRTDGEPDDAEHVFDALLLQAFRQQIGAFDFSHTLSPVSPVSRLGGGRRPVGDARSGPVIEECLAAQITHLLQAGSSMAAAVSMLPFAARITVEKRRFGLPC